MILGIFALLLAFPADDPRVKIDNESVRVLNVIDQPLHPSALHRHELNRVMIYLTDGELTVRYRGANVDTQHWKAGQVAWSPAGSMHISENTGSEPLRIIEIELKRAAPPNPAARNPKLDPLVIDPEHNKLEYENPQVRVFRSWREPSASEMMHEHKGVGRVGVFLTDLNATVKLSNGTESPLHVAAGDVSWSGPVTHATTNLGPNKMEMIVVEIK